VEEVLVVLAASEVSSSNLDLASQLQLLLIQILDYARVNGGG